MASSYPPPPPATNDGPAAGAPDADSAQRHQHQHQHQHHLQHHQHHPQHHAADADGDGHVPTHPQFAADAAAAAAAVAAAHHGLQALQAAVAAPPPMPSQSPVTPQHAQMADTAFLAGTSVGMSPNVKATRLRRACDMCSQRKVKCDETQPCRPCLDLAVDCTFNRTMKRRGPPNKHAEAARAAKQQRLEPNISPGPHNAAEALISIAGAPDPQQVLDAESIAPWPVLTLLIDDFFTYIHPLAPFPHEPTFRMSFTARQDRTNRGFLALLASMIGCLVASFPRTARLHLKTQPHGMHMYPKALTLIDRCRTVALEARGSAFYSRDDVSVYDAATSYFLGLAAAYTMQWKVSRRFVAESMTFIRELGYHKPRDMGSSMFGVTYRGPSFNHVEDQLGKRIFWTLFVSLRSLYQLGSHQSDVVLPPPTPTEPYPEFPVEVDDQYILPHQILGQPEGVLSLLTGFNQGLKIYMTMNGIVSFEVSYGLSTLPFHPQKVLLDESLHAVKQVMDGLPRELTIELNNGSSSHSLSHNLSSLLPTSTSSASVFDEPTGGLHYAALGYTDFRHTPGAQPERRRLLQYEIQKANIHVSQLATRSYYVERYLNLRDAHREHAFSTHHHHHHHDAPPRNTANGSAQDSATKSVAAAALQHAAEQQQQQQHTSASPSTTTTTTATAGPGAADAVDAAMTAERARIVADLLTVLATLSQRSMEPNGASLINKIRQVASTLVVSGGSSSTSGGGGGAGVGGEGMSVGGEWKGQVQQQESLGRFVEILMRLERIPPGPSHEGGSSGGVNGGGGGGGAGGGVVGVGEDEEVELRSWADLREHQVRFLQGGGFMGLPWGGA